MFGCAVCRMYIEVCNAAGHNKQQPSIVLQHSRMMPVQSHHVPSANASNPMPLCKRGEGLCNQVVAAAR